MALLTSKSTAARLLDLLNGAASRVSRSAFSARVAPRAKLHPWTVKWSKRLDSVVIYIPREAVVGKTMNVTRLTPATDAEGNTMPHWYLVDMSKAEIADEVRVSLYENKTVSGLDVDIAPPEADEAPIARVLIARISLPSGSTVRPVVVTQIVTSALSFSGDTVTCLFPGPLRVETVDGTLCLVQRWVILSGGAFTEIDPTEGKPDFVVYMPGGQGMDASYASKIPLLSHAEDHTDGVVTVPTEETT